MPFLASRTKLVVSAGMISMSALAECLEVPEQHVQVSISHALLQWFSAHT